MGATVGSNDRPRGLTSQEMVLFREMGNGLDARYAADFWAQRDRSADYTRYEWKRTEDDIPAGLVAQHALPFRHWQGNWKRRAEAVWLMEFLDDPFGSLASSRSGGVR